MLAMRVTTAAKPIEDWLGSNAELNSSAPLYFVQYIGSTVIWRDFRLTFPADTL
ncbi:hypothetical protein ACRALDRAFT_2019299 [Sodiomyces alcalophilus JCM 7366]|uniref:uncharacterized protein n=1 Tax=Sodiomyces alcalophilus JCM 7366 TaxID=591952 RepID=UPI0039B696F6